MDRIILFFRNPMTKQVSSSSQEEYEDLDQHHGMLKCPSAPNIHQHKLYPQRVPSMFVTPAASANAGSNEPAQDTLIEKERRELASISGGKKQSILRPDSSPNSKASSSGQGPASTTSRVKLSLSPLPPPPPQSDNGADTSLEHKTDAEVGG